MAVSSGEKPRSIVCVRRQSAGGLIAHKLIQDEFLEQLPVVECKGAVWHAPDFVISHTWKGPASCVDLAFRAVCHSSTGSTCILYMSSIISLPFQKSVILSTKVPLDSKVLMIVSFAAPF